MDPLAQIICVCVCATITNLGDVRKDIKFNLSGVQHQSFKF